MARKEENLSRIQNMRYDYISIALLSAVEHPEQAFLPIEQIFCSSLLRQIATYHSALRRIARIQNHNHITLSK